MKREMMGWQWHELDHIQIICTSRQTNSHAVTSSLIFTVQMLFLTPNQQRQSTKALRIPSVAVYVTVSGLYVCFRTQDIVADVPEVVVGSGASGTGRTRHSMSSAAARHHPQ